MSETMSDMLGHPRDGIEPYDYRALHRLNYDGHGLGLAFPRREDQTDGGAYGFLPGEVTVDNRFVRFWLLPDGKLDSWNRYAVLGRETSRYSGDVGFADRLERALAEKYGNDHPRPTVLSSTTAAIHIEDDPDDGVRYVREERTP